MSHTFVAAPRGAETKKGPSSRRGSGAAVLRELRKAHRFVSVECQGLDFLATSSRYDGLLVRIAEFAMSGGNSKGTTEYLSLMAP